MRRGGPGQPVIEYAKQNMCSPLQPVIDNYLNEPLVSHTNTHQHKQLAAHTHTNYTSLNFASLCPRAKNN